MIHSAKVFEVEESPCCKGRIRVRLGDKSLCLDIREARQAVRAMKRMISQTKGK